MLEKPKHIISNSRTRTKRNLSFSPCLSTGRGNGGAGVQQGSSTPPCCSGGVGVSVCNHSDLTSHKAGGTDPSRLQVVHQFWLHRCILVINSLFIDRPGTARHCLITDPASNVGSRSHPGPASWLSSSSSHSAAWNHPSLQPSRGTPVPPLSHPHSGPGPPGSP